MTKYSADEQHNFDVIISFGWGLQNRRLLYGRLFSDKIVAINHLIIVRSITQIVISFFLSIQESTRLTCASKRKLYIFQMHNKYVLHCHFQRSITSVSIHGRKRLLNGFWYHSLHRKVV